MLSKIAPQKRIGCSMEFAWCCWSIVSVPCHVHVSDPFAFDFLGKSQKEEKKGRIVYGLSYSRSDIQEKEAKEKAREKEQKEEKEANKK